MHLHGVMNTVLWHLGLYAVVFTLKHLCTV